MPNYQMVRECAYELERNRDNLMADIDQTIQDAYHYSPEDFINSMYGCFKTNIPLVTGVIEEVCKHPEVLVVKNDSRSTLLGAFKDPNAGCVPVPGHEQQIPEPEHAVHTPGVHSGVQFYPPAIKVKETKLSAVDETSMRYITTPKIQYFNKPSTRPFKNHFCDEVPRNEHKHPMKFALELFASTIINSSPQIVEDRGATITLGTITEALSVYHYTRRFYNVLSSTGYKKAKIEQPDNYSLWLRHSKVISPNDLGELKVNYLITADIDCVNAWRKESVTKDSPIIHPALNYIKLLKDNANRAMCYSFPKVDQQSHTLSIKLTDRHRKVCTYVMPYTPSPDSYWTISFSHYYKKHPLWSNPIKKPKMLADLPALHALQVATVNFQKVAICPTKQFIESPGNEEKYFLPLPVMSPRMKNAIYQEYNGKPYLVHIIAAGSSLTAKNINYVTREQTTVIIDIPGSSATFQALCIAFENSGIMTLAKVLCDTACILSQGIPDHILAAARRLGYFTTFNTCRHVHSQQMLREYWYLHQDDQFCNVCSYESDNIDHEFARTVSLGIPMTSTRVKAVADSYFTNTEGEPFLKALLGIHDPTTVTIDDIEMDATY